MELHTPPPNNNNNGERSLLVLENEIEEDEVEVSLEPIRGRNLRLRDKSLRRRTRTISPLRNSPFDWDETEDDEDELTKEMKTRKE